MNDKIPQIKFGEYEISRLILGGNYIAGGSHLSPFIDKEIKDYFTEKRIIQFVQKCLDSGINTWQSSGQHVNIFNKIKEKGHKLNYISLGYEAEDNIGLEKFVETGTMGVAHHGEFTDEYYKNGKMHLVQEYCKKVRDAGLMVGVSTHMPEVMKYILDEGWDVDFFMCCLYERHRSRQQLKNLLGEVPIPVGEVYLESDPGRMFEVINQTEKPCLAFKMLAAGRKCKDQETVEQAFKTTFKNIKPKDAVIVGMHPIHENQAQLNANFVKKYSKLSTE